MWMYPGLPLLRGSGSSFGPLPAVASGWLSLLKKYSARGIKHLHRRYYFLRSGWSGPYVWRQRLSLARRQTASGVQTEPGLATNALCLDRSIVRDEFLMMQYRINVDVQNREGKLTRYLRYLVCTVFVGL